MRATLNQNRRPDRTESQVGESLLQPDSKVLGGTIDFSAIAPNATNIHGNTRIMQRNFMRDSIN